MKSILLSTVFVFFICGESKAQNVVWGSFKESAVTPDFYAYFDSIICKPDYLTGKRPDARKFLIIDRIVCTKTNEKWYVVLHQSEKHFVDAYYFSNNEGIDSALRVLEQRTPDIYKRFDFALQEYTKANANANAENIILQKIQEEKEKREVDSLRKELDKSLATFRSKNYVLWGWSWSYPNEYSSFAAVDITVINPYKQKIKYLWFTFTATNPVGDPVRDGITGKTEKTVRGIGPIEYSAKGSYTFENVFYSKVIETMKIKQIKIQFFDGSVKVISNPVSLEQEQEDE
jgi:hypothetical protein